MAFKLDAYVLNQKKGGGSWVIEAIESVGVWAGEELSNSGDCPEGTFTGIRTKFESQQKANPDKPKPMTFTWKPPKKDEKLFQSILRNATFHIRMGVNQKENYWTWTFDGVKIIKNPSKKNKIERIEATFTSYFSHP